MALIDDPDAREAMLACDVDFSRLKAKIESYLKNKIDFSDQEEYVPFTKDENGPKPSRTLNRVIQRAVIRVQSAGLEEVNGANSLVAIFAEGDSYAAIALRDQDITRYDVVNFITHGIRKVSQKTDRLIRPVANAPSPFSYGWKGSKVFITAGPLNTPSLPFSISKKDHLNWLEACRAQAERLLSDLRSGKFNVRNSFAESLTSYLEDLPMLPGQGNFLLADSETRFLRHLFVSDVESIPHPFGARLRVLLEQHVALRSFYPEVERFYEAARSGKLSEPFPESSVNEFKQTIEKNTPDVFDESVRDGLLRTEHVSAYSYDLAEAGAHDPDEAMSIPADPIAGLSNEKSKSFLSASAINSIYEAFLKGKDLPVAIVGWSNIASSLAKDAAPVINWLSHYLLGR